MGTAIVPNDGMQPLKYGRDDFIFNDVIMAPPKQRNIVMVDVDALNESIDVAIEFNRKLEESARENSDNPYLKVATFLHECDKINMEFLKTAINNAIIK